jgi:hypothetical protein
MSRSGPLLAVLLAGCAESGAPPDAGHDGGLGDNHLQDGCQIQSDCDDNNPCTIDVCRANSHLCAHQYIDCTMLDGSCTKGLCDRTSGACTTTPAHDGDACTLADGRDGTCTAGTCLTQPGCKVNLWPLGCHQSYGMQMQGTNNLDHYACASGEGGPEQAYPLRFDTDRQVTITTSSSIDVDLIVLTGGGCNAATPCAAASVTPGSGDESVTLNANAGQDYIIVVDTKAFVTGLFTLTISCAGCEQAAPAACNMTIAGDTSKAGTQQVLSSYQCAAWEPGPEDSFLLQPAVDTNYTVKLTGLSTDLALMVLGSDGVSCDPGLCRAFDTHAGTDDKVARFAASAGEQYYALVDSKTGIGGQYQLEVTCAPSCHSAYNALDCNTPSDARSNDDPMRSAGVVDSWSCDANTTGREVVYQFQPSVAGSYTFALEGLTADLDLIVVKGTPTGCDPGSACLAASTNPGTASESVTFNADQGSTYWVAVDGKNGAVSPYTLKLRSASCPSPSCYQALNSLSCAYREEWRASNDELRSTDAIDFWSCNAMTTGPEIVYKFQPPAAGSYTIGLDGLSADLDLMVVSSMQSLTCDPMAACVASSTQTGLVAESVTFQADPKLTYFVAVDGRNEAKGNYHIALSSDACPPAMCGTTLHALDCSIGGRSVSNQNDFTGATADVTSWGTCASGESGPEYAHRFMPMAAGPFTVELIGLSADLDLIVVEADAAGNCNPTAACVAASTNRGTADEKVTFTADPTRGYFLIVDGQAGAVSSYTLAVTAGCP